MQEFSDVENRVRALIANLFELSRDQADGPLRLGNPPEWDSMGHIRLLLAIEDEFETRFPDHEVAGLASVFAISIFFPRPTVKRLMPLAKSIKIALSIITRFQRSGT